MNRRGFLRGLMALGAGIVVVGPSVLADVHRYIPAQSGGLVGMFNDLPQSSLWGIRESTYPRWKPYRLAAESYVHLDLYDLMERQSKATVVG